MNYKKSYLLAVVALLVLLTSCPLFYDDQITITYYVRFAKPYSYSSSKTITGDLPEMMTCVYGESYTMPDNDLICEYSLYSSSKTYYKNVGWTTNPDSYTSTAEYENGVSFSNLTKRNGSTITLYPVFTNDTDYSLKFYTSTSSYDYITLYADDGDIISENKIPSVTVPSYKVLAGWYSTSDSTKTLINFSSYVVKNSNSFSPLFTDAKYKVTFETEYGTAPASFTYTHGTQAIYLNKDNYVLNEKGYTFGGWYEIGDTYSTSFISSYDSGDKSLTAKWTPWKATLSFNKNAPSDQIVGGTMFAQSLTYNTKANLPKNEYYSSEYIFTGWNTKADGSGTAYTDESAYTWKGEANNETLTLYAQWKQVQLPVSIEIVSSSNNSDMVITQSYTIVNYSTKYLPELNAKLLVGNSNWEEFTWFVDNKEVVGEKGCTITTFNIPEGMHSVMATAVVDGKKYSATIVMKLTYPTTE